MKYGLERPDFRVNSPKASARRVTSSSRNARCSGLMAGRPGSPRGSLADDLDAEAVALADGIDHVQVLLALDPAEDRVQAVEVRSGGVGDEELAAAGVLAGVGHAQRAGRVLLGVGRAGLALDVVA